MYVHTCMNEVNIKIYNSYIFTSWCNLSFRNPVTKAVQVLNRARHVYNMLLRLWKGQRVHLDLLQRFWQ